MVQGCSVHRADACKADNKLGSSGCCYMSCVSEKVL